MEIKHSILEKFDSPYQKEWNIKRVNTLISVLGEKWFYNKWILEVGCGPGACGLLLKELGAKVIFTDAREEYVNRLKGKDQLAYVIDNNSPWTLDFKFNFDLVIHWGLLYHLTNWQDDIQRCLEKTNLLCLESEVRANLSPEFEDSVTESGYDQAFSGEAKVPSPANIERVIRKNKATFERFDIKELNIGNFEYDWNEYDEKSYARGQARRFYIVRKHSWREYKG